MDEAQYTKTSINAHLFNSPNQLKNEKFFPFTINHSTFVIIDARILGSGYF